MSYGEWQPYVSVAQRRAKAAREMNKLRSKGMDVEPIAIQSRKIAHTFWGEAWCKHLERFSDFANRLPRGRTYVRNGSVCHLVIKKGKVEAIVSGSELYKVTIDIAPLSSARWENVRKQCAGQIGSMLELLQGHLSSQVMGIVTDPAKGLFPQPGDIKLHCDCPDWADMCKHVAAVIFHLQQEELGLDLPKAAKSGKPAKEPAKRKTKAEQVEALLASVRQLVYDTFEDVAKGWLELGGSDLIGAVLRPALESGTWVVSDRYADSTEAYQGHARGLGPERVRELNLAATGGLMPDLTILLEVEPGLALDRAVDGGRFEAEGEEFQRRVRGAYHEIAARDGDRIVVLDGSGSEQEVHRAVLDAVGARAGS